jgi:transposase
MLDKKCVRVSDEPNVDLLRRKARVLESENERLSEKVSELLRENLKLKGLTNKTIEVNLPGLLAQATGKAATTSTPKSERRPTEGRKDGKADGKKSRKGHGPTEQPALAIESKTFRVDDADRTCDICGKHLERWDGKDDVVDVVERIPAQWIIHRCTLEKCRCPDGCRIVTAEGPKKLISGGRYGIGVALQSSQEKFIFHIPIERQVRMAAVGGMIITSQTLWDQQWALAELLHPLVGRIKQFILERAWLGADLTPFQHIQKGGSVKHQVWQLACPQARYFEMLPAKAARIGRQVFEIKLSANGVEVVKLFRGTAVVDGAPELEKLGADLGFDIANCWSHARRNVLKANSEAPGQVAEFLDLVGRLYAIERDVAGVGADAPGGYRNKVDIEKLRTARNKKSRSVIAEIEKWILAQQCIPGGKLKAGLEYVAGRWKNLTKFLDNPNIPLDNNVTEAGFVGLAQGRRNYVGCRSERGMIVATTFYTVFESARVCGADPSGYLQYAAEMLLDAREPMLPHIWLAAGSPSADTS